MVRLETREAVLSRNPVFAQALRSYQDAFDPRREHNRYDGEEPDAEEIAWFDGFRDDFSYDPKRFRYAGSLVLATEHGEVGDFLAWLPEAFGQVMAETGCESLSCLPVGRRAGWLSERDDYAPLAEAGAALRALGITPDSHGGIVVDRGSVGEVLGPVFWLARCDTGREIWMGGDGASFVANFCQYGSLHCDVYDREMEPRLREAALRAGFVEVDGAMGCGDRFSSDGGIEGRRIEID